MKPKILVIGGAGYIGSHMTLALVDAGYEVEVLDNFSRGYADAVHGLPLLQVDLRDRSALKQALCGKNYAIVLHFAALAYIGESMHAPDLYYQNNVVGTLNLLSTMHAEGIQRFVFSSTCAIYGEPEDIPIGETHRQNPINPYGRSKLIIENTLADYATAYGLRSISLRYFNAAGADASLRAGERHDPETHLIPLVLKEAQRVLAGGAPHETTLNVFGLDFDTPDGSCVRDYIHVTDLSDAHLLAVQRLLPLAANGVTEFTESYNLANGHGFSVLEVIEACRHVTGVPIQYHAMKRRPGDPAILVGSSAKARRILGWQPRYQQLEEIIGTAWAWMRKGVTK